MFVNLSIVFGQKPKNVFLIKFSAVDLILGDQCTKSWSPNIVLEKGLNHRFSSQLELACILPDNITDKSFLFIDIDHIIGFKFNPELKKYIGDGQNTLSGLSISIDCNSTYTKATVSYSEAIVNRLVLSPHLKVGFQSISRSNLVFDISAGLGPGFVFSNSSIKKEDLGILSYHRNILYEGGSGVYLSYYFNINVGKLIKENK